MKAMTNKWKWALTEKLNRWVLYPQRMVIRKLISDDQNYLVSKKYVRLQEKALVELLYPFCQQHPSYFGPVEKEKIHDAVIAYKKLHKNRPIVENKGGSDFNSGLWVFLVAFLKQPDLIIDSGTFRGASAWLMKMACPNAEIHSFDIEHNYLSYRHPGVTYHLKDWSELPLTGHQKKSLIFFDDHINQAQRVKEAHQRGFHQLLFDDNFSVLNIYATGMPALPTLDMVMDERLEDGEVLEWMRNGILRKFVCEKNIMREARALIKNYAILPELGTVTRYSLQSGLSLVELKN